MPVQQRTLTGKTDLAVELQIRDLTMAINELERRINTAQVTALAAQVGTLQQAVNDVLGRIATLDNALRALEAEVAALSP